MTRMNWVTRVSWVTRMNWVTRVSWVTYVKHHLNGSQKRFKECHGIFYFGQLEITKTKTSLIGYFRVALNLCLQARLSAKPLKGN